MKKIKLVLVIMLCAFAFVPTTIRAERNEDESNLQQIHQDDYEFVQLSREEFISQIAELNNIAYEEAETQISANDVEGIRSAIVRGERMPRSLDLKYGYFTGRFYPPSTTNPDSSISTNAYYGVYASYYLPSGNTSWSLRKFNAIHETFLYAGNRFSAVKAFSKNANITNAYNIQFDAKFQMKRDIPGMYYVDYTISRSFGL